MLVFMLFIHVGKRLNSPSQMFFKIGVLKNFAIFTGDNLCWNLFFNKVPGQNACILMKKETPQRRCFPMNIVRFLKTAFLWNTCSLYFSEILYDDGY